MTKDIGNPPSLHAMPHRRTPLRNGAREKTLCPAMSYFCYRDGATLILATVWFARNYKITCGLVAKNQRKSTLKINDTGLSMCYRGGRGIVPPAGVRPDQMIVKFSWWPRDMATQMFLRHTDVAEPPCEGPLCHVKWIQGIVNANTDVANHGNLWHVGKLGRFSYCPLLGYEPPKKFKDDPSYYKH